MKKNIIILARPRAGKSTLLNKVLPQIEHKLGLLTDQILNDKGEGIGFEMGSYNDNPVKKKVIAHVDYIEANKKVSKYGVDTASISNVVLSMDKYHPTGDGVFYLDEIGEMQLSSKEFKNMVMTYLNSNIITLMTMSVICESSFIEMIQNRDDVILLYMNEDNRSEMPQYILQLISKILKARGYIRDDVQVDEIGNYQFRVHSLHGTRTVDVLCEKCDCEFFEKYGEKFAKICSHLLAVDTFRKNFSSTR